ALKKLVEVFQALSSGGAEHLWLESLPFVQAHRSVSILAERSSKSLGLQYAAGDAHWSNPSRPKPSFIWRLTEEDWEEVGLIVAGFEGPGEGHQYLDCLGVQDDVQLVVAMNEYGEDWWQRHG